MGKNNYVLVHRRGKKYLRTKEHILLNISATAVLWGFHMCLMSNTVLVGVIVCVTQPKLI